MKLFSALEAATAQSGFCFSIFAELLGKIPRNLPDTLARFLFSSSSFSAIFILSALHNYKLSFKNVWLSPICQLHLANYFTWLLCLILSFFSYALQQKEQSRSFISRPFCSQRISDSCASSDMESSDALFCHRPFSFWSYAFCLGYNCRSLHLPAMHNY